MSRVKDCLVKMDEVPLSIINLELTGNRNHAEHFFSQTTEFTRNHENECKQFISDLTPGLKHHDNC